MNAEEWLAHASEFTFVVRHDEHRFNDSRFEIARRGPTTWAVVHRGAVLSTAENEFVYEPLPSNREPEFISDTRLPSRESAHDALMRFLATHWRSGPAWLPREKAAERCAILKARNEGWDGRHCDHCKAELATARRQAKLCQTCGAETDVEGYCTFSSLHPKEIHA